MALSPTGIPIDWDCSDALEALLSEDAADGESAPLYSPFSDGSTQSLDSGFATPLVSEEDQFLAGLFGVDCPLLGESNTSTTASPSHPPSPQPLAPSRSENRVHHATAPAPLKQTAMFESDDQFETSSLSPPSSQVCVNIGTEKGTSVKAIDKSRKNAEAARQNRLKKKKYMEDLEKDRSRLKAENVVLKTKCAEFQNKYKKLDTEVAYLRSVLANQSTLATLIKNIPGTPGVNLSTSFSRKRGGDTASNTNNSSAALSSKRPRMDSGSGGVRLSGGVCLHVSKDNVSLEFCSQCSLKAAEV